MNNVHDVLRAFMHLCAFLHRESARNPREALKEDVAIVKYICQQFWTSIFGKKISRLKTDNSVRKSYRYLPRTGKLPTLHCFFAFFSHYLSNSPSPIQFDVTDEEHTCMQGLFMLYDEDFKWTKDLQPTRKIAGKEFHKQIENFSAFTAGQSRLCEVHVIYRHNLLIDSTQT